MNKAAQQLRVAKSWGRDSLEMHVTLQGCSLNVKRLMSGAAGRGEYLIHERTRSDPGGCASALGKVAKSTQGLRLCCAVQ
jgi:hypothetical protein